MEAEKASRGRTEEEQLAMALAASQAPDGGGAGGGGGAGDDDANLTPRSRARIEAIRAIEEKEKAEEDRRLALVREEEEEREKIEKLAKELKGKDYTFDDKGNVILIQPPNPDKLPALVTSMGIAVHSLEGESMPGRAGPKKGGGKKGDLLKGHGGDDKKKKAKRGRKKKSDGPGEFYRDAVSFQQSILQNPTLALAEGVTIHEGDSSKAGPRRQDDPTRMSRKDFMLHQSMLESKSISLSPTGADAGGGMDGLLAGAPSAAAPAAATQGNTASKPPSRPESEHAPGTAGSSAAASSLEADPLEGGSPKVGSGSRRGGSSRRRGKGARSPAGPTADGEEKRGASPVEDPNIALINDPTWGTNVSSGKEWNPPPVPNKADERQQKETFREGLIKHPRDRPYIETSPRKRLPAPLYPANTGIGGMGTNNSDALLPPIPGAAPPADAAEGSASPASPQKSPFPRDFDVTSSPDIVTIANERTKKRFFGK